MKMKPKMKRSIETKDWIESYHAQIWQQFHGNHVLEILSVALNSHAGHFWEQSIRHKNKELEVKCYTWVWSRSQILHNNVHTFSFWSPCEDRGDLTLFLTPLLCLFPWIVFAADTLDRRRDEQRHISAPLAMPPIYRSCKAAILLVYCNIHFQLIQVHF